MKICILARYLPNEGSTIHIYQTIKAFIKKGHEVHLISSGPKKNKESKKLFNDILKEGVIFHNGWYPHEVNFSSLGKLKMLIQYLISIPRNMYILFKIKPDVVHTHYPVLSFLCSIYKKITGKKFIMTYHIAGIPKHILHKKSDYVIGISDELANELKTRFHYPLKSIVKIYNGVPKEKFEKLENKNKLKTKYKLPQDKVILGFVGSFVERKGLDILFKSLRDLDKKVFHLALLGDGDRKWLDKLILENNMNENTSIYPYQDPAEFYKCLDIFVLPSRKEGFGLVSIEAMMSKICVVRSNTYGAEAQIKNGETGMIFESENVRELEKCLNSLIKNEKLRHEIAINGYKHAINNFTDEIMIEKMLHLYHKT